MAEEDAVKELYERFCNEDAYIDNAVKFATKYFEGKSGYRLFDDDIETIRKQIVQFSFFEVLEAIRIAISQYEISEYGTNIGDIVYKLGGICYNRRKANGRKKDVCEDDS